MNDTTATRATLRRICEQATVDGTWGDIAQARDALLSVTFADLRALLDYVDELEQFAHWRDRAKAIAHRNGWRLVQYWSPEKELATATMERYDARGRALIVACEESDVASMKQLVAIYERMDYVVRAGDGYDLTGALRHVIGGCMPVLQHVPGVVEAVLDSAVMWLKLDTLRHYPGAVAAIVDRTAQPERWVEQQLLLDPPAIVRVSVARHEDASVVVLCGAEYKTVEGVGR